MFEDTFFYGQSNSRKYLRCVILLDHFPSVYPLHHISTISHYSRRQLRDTCSSSLQPFLLKSTSYVYNINLFILKLFIIVIGGEVIGAVNMHKKKNKICACKIIKKQEAYKAKKCPSQCKSLSSSFSILGNYCHPILFYECLYIYMCPYPKKQSMYTQVCTSILLLSFFNTNEIIP